MRAQKDPGLALSAYRLLGEAYITHEDTALLRLAEEASQEPPPFADVLAPWAKLWEAEAQLIRYDLLGAERSSLEAESLAIERNDLEATAATRIFRVKVAARQRRSGLADTLVEEALDDVNKPKGDGTTGWLRVHQGSAHLENGMPESARDLFRNAREHASGDPYLIGKVEMGIAYACSDLGDHATAGEHFQRALTAFREIGSARDESIALKGLGYTYWGVLDVKTVRDYFDRALTIADSIGFRRQSGRVYLDLARFIADQDSSSLATIGIPRADQFDSAMILLRRAQALARSIGDVLMLGQSIKTESGILNRTGRNEEALAISRQGYRLFVEVGDRAWMASSLVDISAMQIALGRWKEAIATLDSAMIIADQGGFDRTRMLILNRTSYAYEKLGDMKNALLQKERYIQVKDSVEGTAVVEKLAKQEQRFLFARRLFADSVAHAQQLALEKETSRQQVHRQRTRTQAIAGGGALLLLGGGVAFALDRKRRKERFEKDAARLETQALRSQMNPHFIFNALNSISAFIRQQEPHRAQEFIARFGRLMRLVLENSRMAEVPLKSDLEALGLYLELEQARTENKFDFHIHLEDGLDPEEVNVPPLVMQPFVENSIWHGVSGMVGRGSITIHIRRQGDQLVMDISDDGVGRGEPSTSNVPEKKGSLGTLITKARLDLVQRQKGRPAFFRYIDQAIGTRVELVLPI
ncbi:MAG: histidine kinase [Flavobacteriales bacterium]|nr:histidine kinase [Flavobacteriales bacterium]MBK6754022.1 histidine kinase [Flavobacteriales bacterium]MBK7751838.1 histidine kinase [Flavobacteriales bacterium]MBK9076563.1 histidine kinase [Flavobacteriales bacterium]MBK9539616.1 histidine kinase [Flavobacteriales bacterium]